MQLQRKMIKKNEKLNTQNKNKHKLIKKLIGVIMS